MTTIDFDRYDDRSRAGGEQCAGGLLARMALAVRRLARTLGEKRKARQDEFALNALPDRMLKDMGVARGEIHARVRSRPE